MVKFRCLCCGQKIAVNDAGIGVVIACPTCAERLIVPPRTDFEFLLESPVATLPPVVPEEARGALLPQLAKLMMNRLLQGLLSQRRELLATQDAAAEQIDALEQRVALVQAKVQRRLAYYEERIASLEAELSAKETENHELRQRYRPLGRAVKAAAAQRTGLRPGLVLSA